MTSERFLVPLLVVAVLVAAGGVSLGLTGERGPRGGPCAGSAEPMSRIELVFGMSRKGRPDIGEDEWRQFLDREITPRFPAGLTVLRGEGRWRNAAGASVEEPARVLLVWATTSRDLGGRIDAIRDAWKRLHLQESVLRAESAGCVAF
ncbi:MAG: DUF3574 domain-containing protein [Hyphomicrobiaceae bacterium]|nr:DUF3574 domain-containing protein [Hyphomicrobiaceae bacterium]